MAWFRRLLQRSEPGELFDSEVVARLHHVTLSNPNADAELFPDFLIVGPQRTGSTWVHGCLEHHPEVFVTQPKELFFFNTAGRPEHPQHVTTDLVWYLDFFDEPRKRRAFRRKQCRREFGARYAPAIRGEGTASYAASMDEAAFEDLTALNPDIKAILMVRHPVERAWSHAKKELGRDLGRAVADIPAAELEEFFRSPYQLACADSTAQIDQWSAHLAPGNLFVGLFDHVVSEPRNLMVRIMQFLGVTADPRFVPDEQPWLVINPTEKTDGVPEPHASHLRELLAPQIERIRARLDVPWS